jgi:hypothetical protein
MLIRALVWGIVFSMVAMVFWGKRPYSGEFLDYWLPIASPFIGFAFGGIFGAILTIRRRWKK